MPEWVSVGGEAARLKDVRMADLFADDAARADRMWAEGGGLELDFSKSLLDDRALLRLLDLARARGLADQRDALFAGEPVNNTEGRAALHSALRGVGPGDQVTAADRARAEAYAFADAVRAAPDRYTDVLSLGVGGSDLGPRLVVDALWPEREGGPRLHFVASCDAAELTEVLAPLDPGKTLVIIISKSFGTRETMENARAARDWLAEGAGGTAPADAFAAVTANRARALEFGVGEDRIFAMFDWVGGRYSVWSPVSLAAMIALGPAVFDRFLAGAREMDTHFLKAPLEANIPVLLALLNVWHVNFIGWTAQAVVPYPYGLHRLPEYLSQLVMESNGKRVTRSGVPVDHATAPVTFGVIGTKAQHSFFQALHQGPLPVPADFIGALEGSGARGPDHDVLMANMLAQAEALMRGQLTDVDEPDARLRASHEASHRDCPGNRPTNMILMPRLDAFHLGALIAMYEHRVFAESVIWGINAFDQWGVELGKTLATAIEDELRAGRVNPDRDPSTARLMERYLSVRKKR